MLSNYWHKLVFSVGLGAVLYIGFSVYSDAASLFEAFRRFNWWLILPVLALSIGNFFLRFLRWHHFLDRLDIRVTLKDSLIVFLSGLVMSVTPGKSGELLKALMIRNRTGIPMSRSAAVVLAERLNDIISLIFLAFLGIFTFQQGVIPLLAGFAAIVVLLLTLGWPTAAHFIIRQIDKIPLVSRLSEPIASAYDGVRVLLRPPNLLAGVGLGILAWSCECFGFTVVLWGFGVQQSLIEATFIYSFATLFGAATLLPGGLGTTEGSMTAWLVYRGTPLADAMAATMVTRVCTLWFAVLLGAAAMLCCRKRFMTLAQVEPESLLGVQQG
jgi:uncharacterized protein (TIRG00374 family)